jgi:hypothetical protein
MVVVIAAENLGPLASINTAGFFFTIFDIFFSFKKISWVVLNLKIFAI